MQSEKLVFKPRELNVRYRISEAQLAGVPNPEVLIERVADNLTMQIRSRLLGDTEVVEAQESFPLTWWDAFKLAYFPPYLLNRYPVRLRTVDIKTTITRLCPHIDLPKGSTAHVCFLAGRPTDTWDIR